jgi:aryl-alcohol dehydrogenase-like predicted oxidoreductase/adenylate kinase family enzyme
MSAWLTPGELRIGLGCMRLEQDAAETVGAAVASGITVFDTARAYDGSEALLARALRDVQGARVVTKGGMARPNGSWVPDGRAKAIRGDCEASLAALDGLAIDLYLLHSPDPRTPWRTSLRALAKLLDEGLVARIGVCNVTRAQLDEAVELAPISAVQVALSVFDDSALRAGTVDRCGELGIALVAHSPLGGPRRAGRLGRRDGLVEIATSHGITEAEAALAWLLGLGPHVVAVAGARRPETARSLARAAEVRLDESAQQHLAPVRPRAVPAAGGEVVVVMGIPGAGKSRLAADYVARGFVRLNRDERGGSLRGIADALDETLADGGRQVVLDNTYLTRAARSHVLDVAARHGVGACCIWLDTPLAQAQVNVVERMLERFGRLLMPEELAELARTEQGVMAPTRQMRAVRELEPPGDDEGFSHVERVAFERAPTEGESAVFVAAAAAARLPSNLDPDAPYLVFDWRPGATAADLEPEVAALGALVSGPVEAALCAHPAGPPTCWCRPPLPGLLLEFARRHRVDPARAVVVSASTAHRTLANALGADLVEPA